jgi:monovalent cation/hydrogen antiporter
VVGGQTPTITSGLERLAYLTIVGLFVGLLIGEIVHRIEEHIDDAPIEIALSILTPYVTYLAADTIRASGVLAVVACGLYLSRKSSHFFSANVRLQAWAVWDSLTFILNDLVFVLIGLQLPYVLGAIRDHNLHTLLAYGAGFSAFLIVLRLLWMFPGAYLANLLRRRLLHQKERVPGVRQIFVVGWTGMRGVVSLAAAIALPQMLSNGTPFLQRNMIIFLDFSVILVTLILQGLTLPPLIRALGLAGVSEPNTEEREGRRAVLEAALEHLEKSRSKYGSESAEVYEDLEQHYRHRLAILSDGADGSEDSAGTVFYRRFIDLSRELLHVERRTAVRLRNERRISDELLRELEHELDLNEARLTAKDKVK